MAEALGIAAGIVQLLDLSSRVLLSSSRLYEKLKNVPGEIETVRRNTQQFIDLLQTISVAVYASNGLPPTSTTTQPACIILDAIAESRDLAHLLESLSTPKSNAVKRAWAAVVSVKKQTEIAERSKRIESLKSSLQIWYQHHNQLRLEDQIAQLANSQQLLTSVMRSLEYQCNTNFISNRDILAQLRGPDPQGLLPALEQYKKQERRPICRCLATSDVTSVSLYPVQLFISQKKCHSETCPRKELSPTSWELGIRALAPKIQIIFNMALGAATFSLSAKISPHATVERFKSPSFCAVWDARCNIQQLLPQPFVDYFQRAKPKIGTPHSMDSKHGSIRFRLGLTAAESHHTYLLENYCLQANPALQADVKRILEFLYERLIYVFESGKGSPKDQYADGITILHEVVGLGMTVISMQEDLYFILDKIVSLLISGGADPNTSRTGFQPLSPLGLAFDRVASLGYSPLILSQMRLDRILEKYGGILFEDLDFVKSPEAAGLLLRNPDLVLGMGNSRIHSAVLRRSEEDVRSIIALNAYDLETIIPHPLALAVGWPTGLKIFLELGIETSAAIIAAITQEDVESLELLLDHGCPIFPQGCSEDNTCNNLFQYSLAIRSPLPIISILAGEIAKRRQRLYELALENLPEVWLQTVREIREGASGSVLDYQAEAVFQQLHQIGTKNIQNLYPGTQVTIYHHDGITFRIAEILYEAGFHDLDIADEEGRTPMMNTISRSSNRDEFRLILWYLRKGADPCRIPWRGLDLLRLFAQKAKYFLSSEVWDQPALSRYNAFGVFVRLYQANGVKDTDGCSCWCNSVGFIPVAAVLDQRGEKGQVNGNLGNLTRRRRWLFHLSRYSALGLHLTESDYGEICRLEIFDRLGMAHTCSIYTDPDEQQELRDEDRELKAILDAYVELFLELLHTFSGDFEIFWIAWWIALEVFLPFPWDRERNVKWITEYPQIWLPGGSTPGPGGDRNHPSHQASEYGPNKEGISSKLGYFILTLSKEVEKEKFLRLFAPTQQERDHLVPRLELGTPKWVWCF
ncbi:hypothetical protein EDB80DRAFT_731502 [Ilyonectria destructans]|nr:hypothetical protein EDB80DRAFT_731502 [Ilyonectria destructans]